MTDINTHPEDEVSFKEFKSQLNQFRSFLRQVLVGAFGIARKYVLLLLITALGFAALAFYQYKNQRFYKARSSYIYIESQKRVYGEMMDNLQEMIKTHSYEQVAKSLNISLPLAQTIIELSAVNGQDAKLSEDVTENFRTFYIDASTTSRTTFDSLQTALDYYLNSNPFIARKMAANRAKIEQTIAYDKLELAKLDSLKAAYTNSLGKPNTTVSVSASPFNPTEIYEKSEKLSGDISSLEGVLNDNYKAVQLQGGFMVSNKPSQGLMGILGKNAVYFLVVSFVLVFILSIFKK